MNKYKTDNTVLAFCLISFGIGFGLLFFGLYALGAPLWLAAILAFYFMG